jgi:hypothetical protein
LLKSQDFITEPAEGIMIERKVTAPELGLIAVTRVALGAGLGLLLADRLNDDERRAVGWSLLLVGALTTIPLALEVFGKTEAFDGVKQVEAS